MKQALAIIIIAAAFSGAAHAQTRRADIALDSLPRHYASERAPAYLGKINRQVNRLGLTDCKAHVYEKLRRIEAYGLGPDRARFWPVTRPGGAHGKSNHAIVMIDGYWAMDSFYDEVLTLDDLRRQGYHIPQPRRAR